MECDYEIDFKEFAETGYTLKKPLGKVIGVNDLDDWSMTDKELDGELSEMPEEDFHFTILFHLESLKRKLRLMVPSYTKPHV